MNSATWSTANAPAKASPKPVKTLAAELTTPPIDLIASFA